MARKQQVAQEAVKGLGAELEVPKLVPAVQAADVSLGVIARYMGNEQRKSKGFDRPQLLHMFQLGQRYGGKQFALWGSIQLDMKLRSVPKTAVVFLLYEGKEQGDRGQHNWSVRPFHGTSQDLQDLQDRYKEGCERVVAAVELVESRSQGADVEDDGIPF